MAAPLFGIFPVPEADAADRILDQVLLADRLGLDLVGIQDHPYQRRFLDAWTLLSFLAGRTERIRLFPDVANLPLRPPALLAKAAASLDRLSGGRVELGLGAGAFWEAIAAWDGPVRSPSESVDALEEAIAIIRRVWAAERGIRFEGAHYRLAGAHGGPPPAHDIGIWLGAYGPRMMRLVGRARRRLDPEPPAAPARRGAARGMAAIEDAARRAGRDPARITRLANVNGAIVDGAGDGLAARPGGPLGGGAGPARARPGIRRVVLWPDHEDVLGQTERFAAEVVPEVRAALAG